MSKIVLFLCIVGVLVILKILIWRVVPFVNQYLLVQELDLAKRYGQGTWVLITGPSSGMGERFAWEFAQRGFNLVLLGSRRTKHVIKQITKKYPGIQIKYVELDFSNSFQSGFFDPVQKIVDELGDSWTVLINNVGYRTAAPDYTEMELSEMKKTISVGTLVQAKLIQMALQKFQTRKTHTAIVSITALNSYTTDFLAVDNEISVPYLACYEASNAWGHYHASRCTKKFEINILRLIT